MGSKRDLDAEKSETTTTGGRRKKEEDTWEEILNIALVLKRKD